jgi:hypothetical protein
LTNEKLTNALKKMLEPDFNNRFSSAREADSGASSFEIAHQWLQDYERETDYERALESFLLKLVDEETGTLNPHFAADNLTAVIIT